jgi:hypothetical protein
MPLVVVVASLVHYSVQSRKDFSYRKVVFYFVSFSVFRGIQFCKLKPSITILKSLVSNGSGSKGFLLWPDNKGKKWPMMT